MKLYIDFTPKPGALVSGIRELPDNAPPLGAPWELKTNAEFAAWIAAQSGDVPDQVPKHKLLKAVHRLHGLTDTQIGAELANLGTADQQYEARIDLQQAPYVRRYSPLVAWLGERLEKSSAQLDDLIRYADTNA